MVESTAMTKTPGRTKASAMLDLMRGLAAVLVCLEHWRHVVFVDYEQRAAPSLLAAPFYLLTACGHQAVMIFFVLSGYLIAGSVRRSIAHGTWDWRRYGVARLTRLWVVLVPGLLLCALWDWAGMHSGWAPRLYGGVSGDHVVPNVAAATNWPALWRTLFFLQGILGRTFGSDGPLWSLAYEFWYYVVFPLGLLAAMPGAKRAVRLGCLALLLPIAWLVGWNILELFPVWLAGAALTYAPPCRSNAAGRWVSGVVYLPIFLAASRFGRLLGPPNAFSGLVSDYVVGLATMALLWVLLSAREEQTGAAWERGGHGLASFSLTLYVTHTPLLVLLAAWVGRDHRWQADARHLLEGAGLLAISIAFARGVAWLTEFRTGAVRRWMEGLVLTPGKNQ